MGDAVRVVVGANAGSAAQQLVAAVGRFGACLQRLSSAAEALAGDSTWAGATADRFRLDHRQMAARTEQLNAALGRMAQGARSVVDRIDQEDAKGMAATVPTAIAASAVSGPGAVLGQAAAQDSGGLSHRPDLPEPPPLPTDPRFPPVIGWGGPGVPVVNEKGAFQPDHGGDYKVDHYDQERAQQLMNYGQMIATGSHLYPGDDAARFFQHYLNGSGSDLNYSAEAPYTQSQVFQNLVNQTVRDHIALALATGKSDFDSGYLYNADMFPDNPDWTGAIKGCFFRVSGHRTPQGTWETRLRITSYYQFVPGANFAHGLANGEKLHELERLGIARNYHSIGTATMEFDNNGEWVLPDPPMSGF
ncbi:WXG100 family type VII secretion target [Streptomyces sp. NPDC090499]|uniref:WXG100 family type VII secretion target n=1 Tax=Streptomyces sp. NPDC090499 TaxID=3365965 RepID=UPI00380FE8BD